MHNFKFNKILNRNHKKINNNKYTKLQTNNYFQLKRSRNYRMIFYTTKVANKFTAHLNMVSGYNNQWTSVTPRVAVHGRQRAVTSIGVSIDSRT